MDCGENNYEDRQDSVLVTAKNDELNIFHWNVYENCCCELEPEMIISGDTYSYIAQIYHSTIVSACVSSKLIIPLSIFPMATIRLLSETKHISNM